MTTVSSRPRRQLVHLRLGDAASDHNRRPLAEVIGHLAAEGYRGCVIWDAHRVSPRMIEELSDSGRRHGLHVTVGLPWSALPWARPLVPHADSLFFEIDATTACPTGRSIAGLGLGRKLDVGIVVATDHTAIVEHATRFAMATDARWLWLRVPPPRHESSAAEQLQLTMAYIASRRMRAMHGGRLHIEFEAGERVPLLAESAEVVAAARARVELPLACLLPTLEITADGRVLPMHVDFPQRLALGSLAEAPLVELIRRWRRWHWREFVDCCTTAREIITAEDGWPVFDWSRVLLRAAAKNATAAPSGC